MRPDEASPRPGPFMTAAGTPGSTEPLLLAPADFTKFTAYLENSARGPTAEPRAPGRGRY
jgi:hypothetical protein